MSDELKIAQGREEIRLHNPELHWLTKADLTAEHNVDVTRRGSPQPFPGPVYVTRPILPDLSRYQEKLQQIWKAGTLTNKGPQHDLLETALKQWVGTEHVVLFGNGTIALLALLKALRLSGKVVTTPFTFAATVHAIEWAGLEPVFADIDDKTFNLDPSAVEGLMGPDVSAVLPVHVFGTPCDHRRLKAIADKSGAKLVYDAAHCFGVEVDGTLIATLGDASVFSFHATKIFHTAEGGAVCTNDPELKRRLELLKNFGIRNEENIPEVGTNGKMSELHAALGLLVLEVYEEQRVKRKTLHERYVERLRELPGLRLPTIAPGATHNYYCFALRIEEPFGVGRDDVYRRLREFNVHARKYYAPLISDLSAYQSCGRSDLTVARRVSDSILSLPLYGDLPLVDVDRICDIFAYIR